MIFDSHAHLNLAAFDSDREQILEKYQKEGIFLVNVGTCYETSLKAIELANKFNNCWASIGIHPSHTFPFKGDKKEILKENTEAERFDQKFVSLLNFKKVVAIGECGLDFSYLKDFSKEKQEELKKKEEEVFREQIKVAKANGFPMIFHIRDLYLKALEILEEEKFENDGVFHFFTGNINQVKNILNAGYYLGFSGVITYSFQFDEVIKYAPLDRILVETDAPYVAPLFYKGQRNEPKYVIEVIKKIAEVKNINFLKVEDITFNNAKNLFRINIL